MVLVLQATEGMFGAPRQRSTTHHARATRDEAARSRFLEARGPVRGGPVPADFVHSSRTLLVRGATYTGGFRPTTHNPVRP